MNRNRIYALLGTSLLALVLGAGAGAKTFRYASQGDARTLDPHAMNEQVTLMLQTQIYDPLIARGKNLELEPGLATKWSLSGPKTWRIELRRAVMFHDGAPMTAADVAFSIQRAKVGHQFRAFLAHIVEEKIIDDHALELTTADVDPLLPEKLSILNVMSKRWAEANNSAKVSDIGNDKEEIFAGRNANGTGPFILKSREPGVRTVLVRNDKYWGRNEGNVTEAIYSQIGAAPTRVAALLSGELDLVSDAPLQDIPRIKADANLKVLEGPELRAMLVGMDQFRDAPPHMFDKAGKPLERNPFKDKRVRQAVAHAVDIKAIVDRVMRGSALPAGIASIPGIGGYQADLDVRPAFDVPKAQALMKEAGWGDGFKLSMLCPNNRYVNDTQVCRAIASMLARIGIEVEVDSVDRNVYFSRLLAIDTPFYIIGNTTNTVDTFDLLVSNLMTRQPPNGQVNFGRWSNATFDAAVNGLRTEVDPAKRTALYRTALQTARDEVGDLRLYHQTIVWAMRRNVDAHLRPDNFVNLKWVTVK